MPARRRRQYKPSTFSLAIRFGLLLCIALTLAQAESSGRLTGSVIDPTGRVVPGGEIVLRDWATLIEHSVRTNRQGIYEIRALPVGEPNAIQATARGTGSL